MSTRLVHRYTTVVPHTTTSTKPKKPTIRHFAQPRQLLCTKCPTKLPFCQPIPSRNWFICCLTQMLLLKHVLPCLVHKSTEALTEALNTDYAYLTTFAYDVERNILLQFLRLWTSKHLLFCVAPQTPRGCTQQERKIQLQHPSQHPSLYSAAQATMVLDERHISWFGLLYQTKLPGKRSAGQVGLLPTPAPLCTQLDLYQAPGQPAKIARNDMCRLG
mmetsp:Transcript_67423/g.119538  ORF Transcript_67423/g.119538 Transcript_67423/m.119538 type:complete len:217 (-) Transcript_67423:1048-1698(-)